nr:RAxF-45 family protein [Lederbergia citrisecunda]
MRRRWVKVLNQTVLVHGFWMEFLYFCRAKFAVLVVNGIRMPFFNNFIANLKR